MVVRHASRNERVESRAMNLKRTVARRGIISGGLTAHWTEARVSRPLMRDRSLIAAHRARSIRALGCCTEGLRQIKVSDECGRSALSMTLWLGEVGQSRSLPSG